MTPTTPPATSPATSPGQSVARARSRRPGPLVFVLPAVAVLFFAAPLVALLGKVAWSDLGADLTSAGSRDALRLSLVCSAGAAVLSALFGVPLAWLLARVDFPGRSVVRGLVLLPLVLPPVVAGVALLSAFGRRGIVGSHLYDWFGLQFTFSTAGAVIAETFVAMPFLVLTVEAGLRSMDRRFEDVAATLGAGPLVVFSRVTIPLVAPSLLAGTVLAWARALGEFGATLTFAGNVEGRTRTLPLEVYLQLESRPQVAVALSLVLLAVSFAVLVGLRDRWFAGR